MVYGMRVVSSRVVWYVGYKKIVICYMLLTIGMLSLKGTVACEEIFSETKPILYYSSHLISKSFSTQVVKPRLRVVETDCRESLFRKS